MEPLLHLTTHHPIVDIAQVPHAAIRLIMTPTIMIHTMEVTMLRFHI